LKVLPLRSSFAVFPFGFSVAEFSTLPLA